MIIFMCKAYQHTIVITNRSLVQGDYLTQIRKVCRLHPYALILREKDLEPRAYETLAGQVMQICEEYGVICFLHFHAEIAEKLGCRNIHISIPFLNSLTLDEKKHLRSSFDRISVSCHQKEEAELAVKCGATQIVLGTIFETACKPGRIGSGTDFVRSVCRSCPVPVYAIGGINLERVKLVMEAGAAGGCMMSAFMELP